MTGRAAAVLALLLFGGCQTAATPPGAGTTTVGETTVTVGGSVAADAGIAR